MTTFISVCFYGRVSSKQIEEKTTLGDPGHALPEKVLNFTWCNGLFSAF